MSNFSHPMCILRPRWRVPLGIGFRRMGSKTRVMGLPGRERSLTISSGVRIQSTNVTDGLKDRHPTTAKIVLTISVAPVKIAWFYLTLWRIANSNSGQDWTPKLSMVCWTYGTQCQMNCSLICTQSMHNVDTCHRYSISNRVTTDHRVWLCSCS